jgi:hypothetical protein
MQQQGLILAAQSGDTVAESKGSESRGGLLRLAIHNSAPRMPTSCAPDVCSACMAQKLHMQAPAVKTRLHRARELVREYWVGPISEPSKHHQFTNNSLTNDRELATQLLGYALLPALRAD